MCVCVSNGKTSGRWQPEGAEESQTPTGERGARACVVGVCVRVPAIGVRLQGLGTVVTGIQGQLLSRLSV